MKGVFDGSVRHIRGRIGHHHHHMLANNRHETSWKQARAKLAED
jgi:hypothetical protein